LRSFKKKPKGRSKNLFLPHDGIRAKNRRFGHFKEMSLGRYWENDRSLPLDEIESLIQDLPGGVDGKKPG